MSIKSRDQQFVDLCSEKDNQEFSTNLSINEECIKETEHDGKYNNSINDTDLISKNYQSETTLPDISISDHDLQYSIEFQDSRCSRLFSNIDSETIKTTTSPTIIEYIELTNIPLSDSNVLLDSSTNLATISEMAPNDLSVQQNPDVTEELEEDPKEHSVVEDPDYIPETNDNNEDEIAGGRPKRGRKRKHPDQNRTIRKQKANTNQDYVSAKGKEVCPKQFTGDDFNCNCPKKCTEKVSVEIRKNEFERFWNAGSYEARCAILLGSVKELEKQRSYSANSKRIFTRKYYIANITVCKKTFLNTLGISQTRIDFALQKCRSQAPVNDNRGMNSGGKNAISEDKLETMKQFINSLPRYSSHYCRNSTTANFLAPNLNLAIVYDLYKKTYPDSVSFSRFRSCFLKDLNLRFKKPQKDTCLRCDSFKAKKSGVNSEQTALLEQQHKDHLDHAHTLRNQMKKDLTLAKTNDSIETLTFDLEKTHCLPRLPTNIVYYKRQLNLYNQGIHCGSSGKGYFYIWLEHEAGRGTQEVGSCLKKFIIEHLKSGVTHLILWADSCGGQNRSIKMVLMLMYILQNHVTLQKITLRFLQPGHTYLPNDSEFGDVECSLKSNNRLYTPEDYINVMTNCRRKNKFIVTRLTKEDFRSVAPIQNLITNRKMDINKQKISWMTTFEIELHKSDPFKLFMKSKLTDEPTVVDISKRAKNRKSKPHFNMDLPLLYPDGHELSDAKIKDLREMMKLIPVDAKPFYNFLKTTRSNDFIDDIDGFGRVIDFEVEDNIKDGEE